MSIEEIENIINDKNKEFQLIKNKKPDFLIIDYNTYCKILKEFRGNAVIECNKYEGMTIAVVYHTELELIEVR